MYKAELLDNTAKHHTLILTDEELKELIERFDTTYWVKHVRTVYTPCFLCRKHLDAHTGFCGGCPLKVFEEKRKGCTMLLEKYYPTFLLYIKLSPLSMSIKCLEGLSDERVWELGTKACRRLQKRIKKAFKYVEETHDL